MGLSAALAQRCGIIDAVVSICGKCASGTPASGTPFGRIESQAASGTPFGGIERG